MIRRPIPETKNPEIRLHGVRDGERKLCGLPVSWIPNPLGPVLESVFRPAVTPQQMPLTSTQHARLAQAYSQPDSNLSPEEVQRRQLLSRYHSMLSKAALKRELLKANSKFPAGGASDEGQLAFAGF